MADLKQTTFKIALKTRHKLYINQMVILILIQQSVREIVLVKWDNSLITLLADSKG